MQEPDILSTMPSSVGRLALATLLGFGLVAGAVQVGEANEPSRNAPFPPLRSAQQKPTWLGGAPAGGSAAAVSQAATAEAPSLPIGSPTRNAPAAASSDGVLPDAKWCGIEPQSTQPEPTNPCKLTTLPCGPIGSDKIHNGSGEDTDDLDGDGQRDLVIGGRISVTAKEVFAAIYRGTENGYLLSDYRIVPPRAEPTFASVLLTENGRTPLLRDGHDLVESSGRSLSIARLRRFDGQRFRTLLTFCAHRSEPSPSAPGGVRQGLNRVDFIDVDKDGNKEVVIQGLLAPVVFRFADTGLLLLEDRALTQTYRETSHEAQRARSLRAEAEKLIDEGEVRRAAETYQRAWLSAPYDIELGLSAADAQVRAGQPDRGLDMVTRLRYQAPDRGTIYCTIGAVQKALRNTAGEQAALKVCAEKETDEVRRRQAQNRLRELAGLPVVQPQVVAPKDSSAQSILDEGLGTP